MLWSLALRNLGRNWQRTLATGGAVLFGVAALVFVDAWTRGIGVAIRQYAAGARLGSMQLHAAGYFDRPDAYPLDLTLPAHGDWTTRLAAVPGVTGVAPRIALSGTASNGSDETMFLATAIEPALERRVCPRFLDGDLREGRTLQPDDENVVIVGTAFASALKVDLGSTLTLEVRDSLGRMNAIDVDVVGIAASSLPDEAKWLVVLPLGTAQRLARLAERATSVVISVDDIESVDEIASKVRDVIHAAGADFVDVDVRTWRELGLYFEQAIRTFAFAQDFLLAILACLAGLVVLNAAAVTASERAVEQATMMALGASRRRVAALFVVESLLLGAIAGSCGAIAGVLVSVVAAHRGIVFEAPNQPAVLVHPTWSPAFAAIAVCAAVVTCAIGSSGPAWLVSRGVPARELRR
jgi:putative ABC transport system permease protein